MIKKTALLLAVLFLAYYITTDPAGAAAAARHGWNGLHALAAGLARFLSAL